MPIINKLSFMMTERNIGLTELSDMVGISLADLSVLKNNRAQAMRFTTLEALCHALNCQPGDLLEYVQGQPDDSQNEEFELFLPQDSIEEK